MLWLVLVPATPSVACAHVAPSQADEAAHAEAPGTLATSQPAAAPEACLPVADELLVVISDLLIANSDP